MIQCFCSTLFWTGGRTFGKRSIRVVVKETVLVRSCVVAIFRTGKLAWPETNEATLALWPLPHTTVEGIQPEVLSYVNLFSVPTPPFAPSVRRESEPSLNCQYREESRRCHRNGLVHRLPDLSRGASPLPETDLIDGSSNILDR